MGCSASGAYVPGPDDDDVMILNSMVKNKGTFVPVHVMKAHIVSTGIAPGIHNLSTGEKKGGSLAP
jgi:hypothetical protein